jgi:hypothetical protein
MKLKGLRKFIAFLVTLFCATGLVAFKLIGEGSWSSVVNTALLGFLAANVAPVVTEKVQGAMVARAEAKEEEKK